MILTVQQTIYEEIAAAVRRVFGVSDVPPFAVEVPPSRAMGDFAVTVAFQLARTLRKAPKAIAEAIAREAQHLPGVTRIDVAPNGYLNLYLDRPAFLIARVNRSVAAPAAPQEKTIVEHTAINPNKAAHIGHLRNAALGDTLVRVLRFRGTPVEVQNYIDDTGVQVADVIVGFREIERLPIEEVQRIAETTRFDYYCWDLYARVTDWYEGDKARLAVRAATLHDLEHRGNDAARMGDVIVDHIVRAHLRTMARLNIGYDLLTYEGDILRLEFWVRAFEVLKSQGAVFLQTEGKLAGCWVMRIEDDASDEQDEESREKVIVRSNGVVTYVGKDIANQFWKFGLLGRDFNYRIFDEPSGGRTLWATTSGAGTTGAPAFGHAKRTYNVIDSRQMYLQALLKQALRTLGHPAEADNSVHFSYEMVALSHATARELGYPSESDAARKPFVEVSGRQGLGVKIDDLLDLLTAKASAEVARRNPDFSSDETARAASQIAVGAIRYFMLKFSRGKLIVFDMEEALSFEGETGPYLQYAVVRAKNIFAKMAEREGVIERDVIAALPALDPREINGDASAAASGHASDDGDALWAMVLDAARLDDVVEQVVRTLEFSVLAKFAFGLAQLFNALYHRFPILAEEDADRKRWRAAAVAYVRSQLTTALDLMGIDVPSRM